MDYCIPHMLFFKCLILTESYKTLEGVMCGTSLPTPGESNAKVVYLTLFNENPLTM